VQVNNLRRSIDQLRNEQFEYEMPKLIFSEEKLEIKAAAGEKVRGGFRIQNTEERKIRGFLYSSSARVICDPKNFSGRTIYITYEADRKSVV